MAEHAPTPWSKDESGHIIDAKGEAVFLRNVDILLSGNTEERRICEANTDLFFAAPEMLAMLKRVAPFMYEHAPPYMYAEIGALIAKAEGKEA